jgi:hypothetical protein
MPWHNTSTVSFVYSQLPPPPQDPKSSSVSQGHLCSQSKTPASFKVLIPDNNSSSTRFREQPTLWSVEGRIPQQWREKVGWSGNAAARKEPRTGRSLSTRNADGSRNLFSSSPRDRRSGRVQQRRDFGVSQKDCGVATEFRVMGSVSRRPSIAARHIGSLPSFTTNKERPG